MPGTRGRGVGLNRLFSPPLKRQLEMTLPANARYRFAYRHQQPTKFSLMMILILGNKLLNPRDHLIEPLARLEIGEYERQITAHTAAIPIHDTEICADMRSEIDLVDHEQIGTSNPRTTLARDLIAGRHINDIDHLIGEFRTECRSQIVATALDEHEFDAGMALQ